MKKEDNATDFLRIRLYVSGSGGTARNLHDYLLRQPKVAQAGGRIRYYNPATGVAFKVSRDESGASAENLKNVARLESVISVPLGVPEYAGLEMFPIIESLGQDLDVQFGINSAKPKAYTAEQMHKIWLKSNDERQKKLWREDDAKELAYQPREQSNAIWRYLDTSAALEVSFKKARNKTIVCKPMRYRSPRTTGEVITVVPWLDYHKVSFIIPPYTKYLFRIRIAKRFGIMPYPTPIGYIETSTLLEGLEDKVVMQDDGSILVPKEAQPFMRERAEDIGVNFPSKHKLGTPLPPHSIVDAR